MLHQWLHRLRHEHAALAEDVIERRRFFWLGSGLSREQAPDVVELVRDALVFLRENASGFQVDAEDHKRALRRILAEYLPDELARYDIQEGAWIPGDLELTRNSYSQILATRVDHKAGNYLLMEGVKVPEKYGAATLTPGPDHQFLGLLIAEGVLADMASGNWDGLVEKAVSDFGGPNHRLSVHVIASDIRDAHGSAWLTKFHGCAVRAIENPVEYGPAIIATTAQISRWSVAPEFAHMRDPLIQNVEKYRSLILGLSVQDSDLLNVFTIAAAAHPWRWEADHPAYVFAERSLSASQEDLLENSYGSAEYDVSRVDIVGRSTFGEYSRSLLAALVIYVIVEKMKAALRRHGGLPTQLLADLEGGLAALETLVSKLTRDRYAALVAFLAGDLSTLVRHFYSARHFSDSGSYLPLIVGKKSDVERDPIVTILGADWFALTMALVGSGSVRSGWRIRVCMRNDHSFLQVSRPGATPVLLAIVANSEAADAVLQLSSWTSGDETIAIVHAGSERVSSARSSGSRLGAGRGASLRREVWLPEVLRHVVSVDEAIDNLFAGGGA